ncbi:hypothetical protein EBU24_03105 [bacterium]|nr:hypothetical protein [bacterium]
MNVMNKIKFKKESMRIHNKIFGVLFFITGAVYALPPINSLRVFDSNNKIVGDSDKRFSVQALVAGGFNTTGYNANGDRVNALHYLSADQNSLAMVKGFDATTEQAAIAQQFNINDDDGVRGHLVFTGNLSMPISSIFTVQKSFGNSWFVGLSLPIYSMKLSNLQWSDQTQNVTFSDNLAKTLITNNLAANVERLGSGMQLKNWSKTGPGDITILGGYRHSFVQNKPWIKNVTVNVRSGFMLPTGLTCNEDLIMNFPFGNDGSVGLVVGAGIDVDFKQVVDAGIDVEFLHVFNNTRNRRIKVDANQTDFLMLTKTEVQKDPGFFQKFNLYVKPKICTGFSFLLAYQFAKKLWIFKE